MSLDDLQSLFDYNPDTGVFTRKVTTSGNAKAGMVAGCRNTAGYLVIRTGGKTGTLHYAHRLAWWFYYGAMPPKGMDIDHINGNKSDNRIANLRLATRGQNNINTGLRSNNTTGHKGIKFTRTGKWTAWINLETGTKWLGTYERKEDAIFARQAAEAMHYKQFRRAA